MVYSIKNDLYLANYPWNDIISSKKAFLANLAGRRGQEEKKEEKWKEGRRRRREEEEKKMEKVKEVLELCPGGNDT